jgi:membrane protease YdiL (CAAX protease family)
MTNDGATREDPLAVALRGFGPVGILAILVISLVGSPPISAVLILVWAARSGTPWRELGYVRPRSWFRSVVIGVVLGAAFKLTMKAVVMPLLGADPINQAYHYLVGNTAALPGMIFTMIVGAGLGEETYADQGLAGVQQATIVGVVYGTIFAVTAGCSHSWWRTPRLT